MAELLLEIFSEEIPARMQARAADDLKRLMSEGLESAGIKIKKSQSFATPRRLALVMQGLPESSPEVKEERKGPRVGAPDQAVEGFLRAAGLKSVKDASIVSDDKKGDYYVARVKRPGRPAREVIAEVVPDVVRKFPWPKSMRWGSGRLRWVRPIHSILCLFDGKVVAFEIDGIKSGKRTSGHRFLAPKPFDVKNFKDYAQKLKKAKVILNAGEREKVILAGARKAAKAKKLALVEDAALLAENAGLTEWPVALTGAFDESFLDVPPEVLTTAMKAHQKCFSVTNPKTKNLAANFVVVANLEARDKGKAVAAGNERVIRARLADAKFFWDQDRKLPLEERVMSLRDIIFHEKLGTQYERMQRLRKLAREIAPVVGADPDFAERAGIMAKADLVSGMVGEFPELQGVMGRYYALDQQEDKEVADAIADHYRPQGPNDDVPSKPVSIAVALADKLDTLVGFWAIGEKPTGSKDPYALRRAALGIIRLALENGIRLNWTTYLTFQALQLTKDQRDSGRARQSLDLIVDRSDTGLNFRKINELEKIQNDIDWQRIIEDEGYLVSDSDAELIYLETIKEKSGSDAITWTPPVSEYVQDLLVFLHDRLKVHLRDRGARYDLIDAVISDDADDLLMIVRRVEALGRFLDTDDGANLLTGVKRAVNILRIEEKKDSVSYDGEPDAGLYRQEEERALAGAITDATKAAGSAVAAEDFEGAMTAMARLRKPVDVFFDTVTVNAEDRSLRANRLKLLSRIRAATLTVADFSRIEG